MAAAVATAFGGSGSRRISVALFIVSGFSRTSPGAMAEATGGGADTGEATADCANAVDAGGLGSIRVPTP